MFLSAGSNLILQKKHILTLEGAAVDQSDGAIVSGAATANPVEGVGSSQATGSSTAANASTAPPQPSLKRKTSTTSNAGAPQRDGNDKSRYLTYQTHLILKFWIRETKFGRIFQNFIFAFCWHANLTLEEQVLTDLALFTYVS